MTAKNSTASLINGHYGPLYTIDNVNEINQPNLIQIWAKFMRQVQTTNIKTQKKRYVPQPVSFVKFLQDISVNLFHPFRQDHNLDSILMILD